MPKILVVDDERVMVKGIKFNLENEGYQVDTGSDGEEAVDKETAQIIRAAAAYVPQSVFTTCIRQEEELFQALEAQGVQVRQGDYTILNRAAREYFRKNYQELGMSQRAWEQILPVIS